MGQQTAAIYGLDIETDTSHDGLDPAVARVRAVALSGRTFDDLFVGDEADLLRQLDDYVIPRLEAIDARLSNLEMSLLEVRDALATPPQSNVGADLAERIAGLERRNEDVTDALRSVLAMLTARKDMRATG